jgi:uncharacterized protein
MLARLLRFCLLGFLLTGCTSMSSISNPWANEATPPVTTPISAPTAPHHIALLLPQQGDLANAAKIIQAGFNDAYQQSINKPTIKVYDTSQNQSINNIYDQAINDGADYVVGPLDKNNVASLQSHSIKVITIALNSTDSSNTTANLYQFGLSPIDEAQQVADKASQEGHHAALLITPAGSWGNNIATALQQRWQNDGGTIVGSMNISNSTNLNNQVRQLLEVQGNTRRQDVDAIFLIAQPVMARQIKPLLKFYYANDIAVYSTSLVYSGTTNSAADTDLDGIKFCDMPLVLNQNGPWSQVRQQFTLSQPGTFQQYIRLYGLGWDAALLTQQFSQLSNGNIDGATGNLHLDNQQHILRQLNWAVFSAGNPTPIS